MALRRLPVSHHLSQLLKLHLALQSSSCFILKFLVIEGILNIENFSLGNCLLLFLGVFTISFIYAYFSQNYTAYIRVQ